MSGSVARHLTGRHSAPKGCQMRRTKVLQEIQKMRFIEAYGEWNAGRLTQAEAGMLPGLCERSFRR